MQKKKQLLMKNLITQVGKLHLRWHSAKPMIYTLHPIELAMDATKSYIKICNIIVTVIVVVIVY